MVTHHLFGTDVHGDGDRCNEGVVEWRVEREPNAIPQQIGEATALADERGVLGMVDLVGILERWAEYVVRQRDRHESGEDQRKWCS